MAYVVIEGIYVRTLRVPVGIPHRLRASAKVRPPGMPQVQDTLLEQAEEKEPRP